MTEEDRKWLEQALEAHCIDEVFFDFC